MYVKLKASQREAQNNIVFESMCKIQGCLVLFLVRHQC